MMENIYFFIFANLVTIPNQIWMVERLCNSKAKGGKPDRIDCGSSLIIDAGILMGFIIPFFIAILYCKKKGYPSYFTLIKIKYSIFSQNKR